MVPSRQTVMCRCTSVWPLALDLCVRLFAGSTESPAAPEKDNILQLLKAPAPWWWVTERLLYNSSPWWNTVSTQAACRKTRGDQGAGTGHTPAPCGPTAPTLPGRQGSEPSRSLPRILYGILPSLWSPALVRFRLQNPDVSSRCFPLYPQQPFYLSAATETCGSWQENNQQVPLSATDIRDTGMFKPCSCSQPLSACMQLYDPWKSRAALSPCPTSRVGISEPPRSLAKLLSGITPGNSPALSPAILDKWQGVLNGKTVITPMGPLMTRHLLVLFFPLPLHLHQTGTKWATSKTASWLIVMQETLNLFLNKGWVLWKIKDRRAMDIKQESKYTHVPRVFQQKLQTVMQDSHYSIHIHFLLMFRGATWTWR